MVTTSCVETVSGSDEADASNSQRGGQGEMPRPQAEGQARHCERSEDLRSGDEGGIDSLLPSSDVRHTRTSDLCVEPGLSSEGNEEQLSSDSGDEYDEDKKAKGDRTNAAGQRKRPWPYHQRKGARGDADMSRPPSRRMRADEGCQGEKPREEMAGGATTVGRPELALPLAVSSNEDGGQAADNVYCANLNRDLRERDDGRSGDEQGRAEDSAVNGERSRRRGAESNAGAGARRAGARRGFAGCGLGSGAVRGDAPRRERGRGD